MMKKTPFTLLVLAGVGFFAGWYLLRLTPVSSRAIATEALPAVVERSSAAHGPKGPPIETEATAATRPISLLDQNNPAYATALALMDQRFLRSLTGRQGSMEHVNETLRALARSLSVAHLSQTMYEATIADVVTTGSTVTITIPPYPREGEYLQRYVRDELLADIPDPRMKQNALRRFGQWGESRQTLIVTPTDQRDPYDGSILYQIEHRMGSINGTNSSVGISTLSVWYFGPYTAFAGWFPK
jgi:hypothetical protein